MRPRTATIQVSNPYPDQWKVEIGDDGAPMPLISIVGESLDDVLVEAIFEWKDAEGLGD